MKRILVTYGRNRIAYVSTKSLAEKGYEMHVGDSVRFAMTFFSRYCRKKFIYHCPFLEEKEYIEDLIRYIKDNKIDFLLPSLEEGFVIAKNAEKFKGVVKMLMPSYKLIEIANNKKKISDVLEEIGVMQPKTFKFEKIAEFKKFLKGDIKFPVVIKPRKGKGSAGLYYAHNRKELRDNFVKVVKEFKIKKEFPLIQEYIDGYGLGVSFLYKSGKMLAYFTHKRLIETSPSGGFSVERISASHKKAEEAAKKIMDHLRWNGVAMTEFRIDKKTREPYFLEINPRFWGSLNQAVQSGVDFPYLVIATLEGKKFPIPKPVLGVRTRWFWGGVFFLPKYVFAGRWKEVKVLLNIFDKKLHFDDFSFSDPLPFLVNPIIPLTNLLTRGKVTFETRSEEADNFNC